MSRAIGEVIRAIDNYNKELGFCLFMEGSFAGRAGLGMTQVSQGLQLL